eukprot:1761616-Rhodomonas_salina.1
MLNADAMLLMVCQMRSSLSQMPGCRQAKPTLKQWKVDAVRGEDCSCAVSYTHLRAHETEADL